MTFAVAADGVLQSEPRRVSAALVVATLVTLAAAIPLGLVAWSARNDTPADSDGLYVAAAGETHSLAGRVLSPEDPIDLQVIHPDLLGIAWTLYDSDGAHILADEAVGRSPFELDLAPGRNGDADLGSGTYDLLVTGTLRDGSVIQRAATFAIGDTP